MAFKIIANGEDMGVFDGRTGEEALTNYVHAAGYASVAEAALAQDQHEDEFRAEVRILAHSA